MILASRKTYQKLSSNGLDLADLSTIAKLVRVHRAVDHRQILIDSVTASQEILLY
jgi:hypothetical protein